MFKRSPNGTNYSYPPEDVPGPKPLSAWVSAYQKAKSRGLIPSIKPSVLHDGEPTYHSYSDFELQDPQGVCSWTVSKCSPAADIIDAPRGSYAISFDDGPQNATSQLLPFLKQNNQLATHFMIGSRILDNPQLLIEAANLNHDHIAVHTWSHPFMTTLTDEGVLGEIGWTLQIIHDFVGLLPAFWRPPYGDIDNRVRAISEHVFGLKTVMWSTDPNDWCLSDTAAPGSDCSPGSGPQNFSDLVKDLRSHIEDAASRNATSQEKGIISLEHELSRRTVEGFIKTYPLAKEYGWDTRTIPDLFGLEWYQKATPNSSQIGVLPLPEDDSKPFNLNGTLPATNHTEALPKGGNGTTVDSNPRKSPSTRVPRSTPGGSNRLPLATRRNVILPTLTFLV